MSFAVWHPVWFRSSRSLCSSVPSHIAYVFLFVEALLYRHNSITLHFSSVSNKYKEGRGHVKPTPPDAP